MGQCCLVNERLNMSKLSYICNQEQIQKAVKATSKTHGEYHFIRKNEEKPYYAYRRVDSGKGKFYYVRVQLSPAVFKELILSGVVPQQMK